MPGSDDFLPADLLPRFLAVVDEAAAAAMAFWSLGRAMHGHWEKSPGEVVSEADLLVDRTLKARLAELLPDAAWLSEESVETPGRADARRAWVVDPIDGTRDFVRGRPGWAVSVALVEDGAAVAAALFVPAREELFEATAGGGARLNGEAIRVSDRQALEGARIAGPARHLRAMAGHGMDPRERRFTPSLAYRFALVACGRVDVATARPGAYDWDLAAVDLLVQEAGGTLRDLEGAPLRFNDVIPRHPALIASTPGLASAAMAIIAEAEAAHEASGPGAL